MPLSASLGLDLVHGRFEYNAFVFPLTLSLIYLLLYLQTGGVTVARNAVQCLPALPGKGLTISSRS